MFEELRLVNTKEKHEWNWELLDQDDLISKKEEGILNEEGGEIADQPGPRTAAVMTRYGDKLILFGGSGPYIKHIRSRRAYYDIFLYDTAAKRWNQRKEKVKGT